MPASLAGILRKAAASMAACAALALAAAPGTVAQVPASTVAVPASTVAAPTSGFTLPGHVPALVSSSAPLGPVLGAQPMFLALTLPLRDLQGLEDTNHSLYNAASPTHGQYLTPAQFTAQFGSTQADYDALTQWAVSKGFVVTNTNPSRTILDVSASAATVQAAFNIHLQRYLDPTGREFFAPDADPTIDPAMAGKLSGVIGLDDATPARPSVVAPAAGATPSGIGTGPGYGLTPQDIRNAYNLNGPTLNGAGQKIALFELNGFLQPDIQAYEAQFGLPNVYVQQVYLDGYSGGIYRKANNTDAGQLEVTLDIELAIALAPEAASVTVYEVPDNPQGVIDEYSKIAQDDNAQQISTSWGLPDNVTASNSTTFRNVPTPMTVAEYTVFAQMAAQGQTIYSASGDNGAYDNGYSNGLLTHDPASQHFVCAVGGTTLATNGAGGTWYSETTWNAPYFGIYYSSGGGISGNWQIPWYQYQPGVYSANTNQGGSPVNRDVPDVALDADPNTGYAIYESGGWVNQVGGTSCAAPLWAGFTALVNQQRNSNGLATLGFINPYVYQIGRGSNYTQDFHDITQGNNFYYPAGTGYDAATGRGSFNGLNLFNDLSTIPAPSPVPLPFYQVYNNGDDGYFFSTSLGDVRNRANYGYNFQGIACRVYGGANDVPGLIPLYHVQNPTTGDHYYPISASDKSNAQAHGYTNDNGIACYVFPDGSTPGTVPLYGAYYVPTGQHYLTTSLSQYNSLTGPNWQQNGIRCYVLP